MGNKLCLNEGNEYDHNNHQKNGDPQQSLNGNNPNWRKNQRLNSIIDLNEYKLPSDPAEKKLYQSIAAKELDGEDDHRITLQSFRIIRVLFHELRLQDQVLLEKYTQQIKKKQVMKFDVKLIQMKDILKCHTQIKQTPRIYIQIRFLTTLSIILLNNRIKTSSFKMNQQSVCSLEKNKVKSQQQMKFKSRQGMKYFKTNQYYKSLFNEIYYLNSSLICHNILGSVKQRIREIFFENDHIFKRTVLLFYKVSFKSEEIYAMKVYDKMTLYEKNIILNTIGEKNILKNMNSSFIVKLHYAFQAGQKLYLMMDFMVGGELYYHLKNSKKFDEQRTKFYIAQVILAIECLHQHDIMYRDLKLENILLGQDGYIKLTDFGLSKEGIKDKDLTNTLCGTAEYMAPEQILNQGHNKMADFWQIGVLTYEMLYGTTPFINEFRANRDEIFNDIVQVKYTFPQFFTENSRSFIRSLLQKDVKKRLGYNGFSEIKKHPFFSDQDWNKLESRQIEPQFKPPLRSQIDLQNLNPKLVKNTMTDLAIKDNNPPVLKDEIESQFKGFTFVKDDPINADIQINGNSSSNQNN